MHRYYDAPSGRLLYFGSASDSAFWDRHWKSATRSSGKPPVDRRIVGVTDRYLGGKGRLLEGGCGAGGKLYSLHAAGYEAHGIDFARETVENLNARCPELKVCLGDVAALPFEDAWFDGYWSLGVIEHFRGGYEPVLREMRRVLRVGGYLFLTFPQMSWLRRMKARLGFYPLFQGDRQEDGGFYQYALPAREVVRAFEANGFRLMEGCCRSRLKGLKDECRAMKPLLQRLYSGSSRLAGLVRIALERILPDAFGHSVLLVFRREGDVSLE